MVVITLKTGDVHCVLWKVHLHIAVLDVEATVLNNYDNLNFIEGSANAQSLEPSLITLRAATNVWYHHIMCRITNNVDDLWLPNYFSNSAGNSCTLILLLIKYHLDILRSLSRIWTFGGSGAKVLGDVQGRRCDKGGPWDIWVKNMSIHSRGIKIQHRRNYIVQTY